MNETRTDNAEIERNNDDTLLRLLDTYDHHLVVTEARKAGGIDGQRLALWNAGVVALSGAEIACILQAQNTVYGQIAA